VLAQSLRQEVIDLSQRGSLERAIVGSLRSAITAHGPVTDRNVSSAAKRVISVIKVHNRTTRKEETMNLLERAYVVARIAHEGQVDKSGVDYFEHLRAVADMVDTEDEKIVALLHDIVEDTPMALHDLVMLGFLPHHVDAVRLLTHTHEHTHAEYVRAIRDAVTPGAPLAQKVKRADLKHNSDPKRAVPGDQGWMKKRYDKATAILDGKA
jgi:molybdopterin-guanine dinucleotide biosynthesis protein